MAASFVKCSNVRNVRNDRISFEHSNTQTFEHSANAIDKAVRAQGGAVVKPHQVKAMILAARRAYLEQRRLGLVDDGVGFDAWRRATLHDVVAPGAPDSFRTVTQRDYARVVAYFLELAGDGGMAAAAQDKTADERRRALRALTLEEGRLAEAYGGREGARKYADALFGKIHRTDRHAASARQIWAVIFTLRNRAAKKKLKAESLEPGATRAKTALGALGAAGVPLSPPEGSERFPAFSRGL